MKNLKLATSLCSKIEEAAGAQCVDVNFDNGTIYIATDRQLLECDPGSGTVSLYNASFEDLLTALQ
jgi:hypothetical protein